MKLPKRKFNTIVIDPPWKISLTGEVKRRGNRAKKLPYKTMSLQEIKDIPIKEIANKGCHVYCWTTNKMLKETFDVLESWGVNFHLVMPMVKPSGIAPCMGYVFASEFCLLGFYGKPMQKFKRAGKLNWIKAFNKAGTHSSKPEEFYNLVKEMSPFPRIDIFARIKHSGFEPFGDEAPKFFCPKCRKELVGSDLEDYEWLCNNCDENFYHNEIIEQIFHPKNQDDSQQSVRKVCQNQHKDDLVHSQEHKVEVFNPLADTLRGSNLKENIK